MDGLSELLFGRFYGNLGGMVVAARLFAVIMSCAALFLLGRRNQIGWWLLIAGVLPSSTLALFTTIGPLASTPAAFLLNAVSVAIPLLLTLGVGIYGFLSFQKFPLLSSTTRNIALRPFSPADLLLPVLVAIAAAVGSMLSTAAIFLSFTGELPPASMLLTLLTTGLLLSLMTAGVMGLAQLSRWAWFLVAAASLVQIFGATMSANGSVVIFLTLVQGVLAVYGWVRWGTIPKAPKPLSTTAIP